MQKLARVPSPAQAQTINELIIELRLLKVWAGNPSITRITRRVHRAWQEAGRPQSEWPARSTIGNCFQTGRPRPNVDLLLAVVHALVDGDPAAVASWGQALCAILADADIAGQATAYDRLPPDPAQFTGRSRLIAELLDSATSGTQRTIVLQGMPGIGKTTTAVHLAHRLVESSQPRPCVLFVDLHGFAADRPHAAPTAVLQSFLRMLAVPDDRIPYRLSDRASLYRRRLAETPALVILDNAANAEQVRHLLPHSPTCTTLITSRQALTGLRSATHIALPPLTDAEALQLLQRTAQAERVTADPRIAEQIAGLLDRLPLAVSIVGRHMRDHDQWTMSDYYPQMAISLAMEGGVRDVLAVSDRKLLTEPRQLLRLLALHPDQVFDVDATAALTDQSVEHTRNHLDTLVAANLLQSATAGRYRLHNLVRLYATERLGVDQPPSRTRPALLRLFHHYAVTGRAVHMPMGWQRFGGAAIPGIATLR